MNALHSDLAHWENRLSTYVQRYFELSKCSHPVEELVAAGFFYTGVGDCVRCFYCGLGLKAWGPCDNIHVEHQRYRPDCAFLQAIAEFKRKTIFDMLDNDYNYDCLAEDESNSMSQVLSVLQMENKHLKRRNICRVCVGAPAREIFMPCGHIAVCRPCSEILNVCPSCGKTVSATASVFLT